MAGEEHPIEYYIEHPEAVDPTDSKLVERLLAATGEQPAEPEAEKPKEEAKPEAEKPKAEAKPETKPEVEKPKEEVKPEEPKGVLAADGKSVIPYSVLAGERQKNAQLNTAVGELTQVVNDLTATVESLQKGGEGKAPPSDAAIEKVRETIEKAREEAPWLAETLEAMLAGFDTKVKALNDRIETLTSARAQEETEIQNDVRREVTTAIDQVPVLAHLKASNPEAFATARAFDDQLKALPAWEGRPMVERFRKVAELTVAALGEDIVPAELRVAPQPAAKPQAKAGLTDAEVKAAAQGKLKENPGVTTLTDLPGGASPAQTEEESLENISVQDLHRKFEKMSPDQIAAYVGGFR
jgi:hypothetical protein